MATGGYKGFTPYPPMAVGLIMPGNIHIVMSKRRISISVPAEKPTLVSPPPEPKSPSMPLIEDLARREKTPFIMTSVGRRAKNALGWESGQTMYFSPDEPR